MCVSVYVSASASASASVYAFVSASASVCMFLLFLPDKAIDCAGPSWHRTDNFFRIHSPYTRVYVFLPVSPGTCTMQAYERSLKPWKDGEAVKMWFADASGTGGSYYQGTVVNQLIGLSHMQT